MKSNPSVEQRGSSFIGHLRRRTASGTWIPELDGLRFIAIVSVVFYHLQFQLAEHFALNILPRYAYALRLFANGNRGVPLFFIISGFILARPFAQHHLFGNPAPALRKYFIRRITRLEPPYLLNLVVVGVGVVFVGHVAWRTVLPHVLASIGYVHYLIYKEPSTINFVAWSLEVEVQFYILAPLLALLFKVSRAGRRRFLIVGLMLAMYLLQVVAGLGLRTLGGQLQYFLAGLLFADLFLTVMPRWKHDWRWDLVSFAGWPFVFLLDGRFLGLWLPFLALLLYVAAFRGVLVYAMLRKGWIAATGGMCYTIYLWHTPVLALVNRVTEKIPMLVFHDYALLFLAQGVLKIAAIAVVCVPLFLLVERPCMDPGWPQKLLNRLRRYPNPSATLVPLTVTKL